MIQKINSVTKLVKILFASMFIQFWIVQAFAQDTILVKGIVVSDDNKPMKGVAVNVVGMKLLPVLTNDSGFFEVKSVSTHDVLNFAPIGNYKTNQVFRNGRTFIKVYIVSSDVASGSDLSKILAQNLQNRDVISAYTKVSKKNIPYSTDLSVDQYLQGKVPGLQVVNASGAPGNGTNLAMRGINSLYANTQPLFIIDGIPVSSINVLSTSVKGNLCNPLLGLNMLDISDITVIKDPTVTSTYGSKASNGVIVIETLDPSATQTSIELDIKSGFSLQPANKISQLNASQHKVLMNEILFTNGKTEEINQLLYPGLFYREDVDKEYIDFQHNTNWQDYIFGNAAFKGLNVKVKGGDEIAKYGLSFGYNSSNGIMKNTDYKGYNLRFLGRVNIFKWLKMDAGVSLNISSANLREAGDEQTSPILTSLAKSPLLNPYQYDDDNNMLTDFSEVNELGVSNPVATINNYSAFSKSYSFTANVGFTATINKYLSAVTKLNISYDVSKEDVFMPYHGMERYYNDEINNVAKGTNNDLKSFYNNTYLYFNRQLGKCHKISSSTGFILQTNKYQLDWGVAKNSSISDQYRTLSSGDWSLKRMGGKNINWNWGTFYENINYSLLDRYIASASASFDGTSNLGEDADKTVKIGKNRFGFFYSGGLAWRVSSEGFLKNIAWLDELKIRATIGKSGNDDVGESNSRNYYQTVLFRETAGLYPAIEPNKRLTYEIVKQLNGGIDLSVFASRFSLHFDIFKSTTDNLLIYSPLESYTGYEYEAENRGKLENKGWEMASFARIISKKNFKWDLNITVSTVKNEILELEGNKAVTIFQGGAMVNQVGSSANAFYGYIYEGVYSTTEKAQAANLVNDKNMAYSAGDAIFKDISGPNGTPDGVINAYDKTIIGSAIPDCFGSMGTVVMYKNWSLSATVQFVLGNEIFNYVRYLNERMTGLENQSKAVVNRWQNEEQITNIPRALWNDPIGNSSFSTRWIEDGSYWNIKNISLSYKFPKEIYFLKNVECYASVNNLLLFSKYLGYNPEFAYSRSQNMQGIDYGQTPMARQFLFGVRLGF